MTAVRFLVIFVGVVAVYYWLPHPDKPFDAGDIVVLIVGTAIVISLVVWEIRSITRAKMPQLRAVEAVAMLVPLFFTAYAAIYSTVSDLNPATFSEPMNRTGALYFSIVTLGTVGYGDIAPKTDAARLLVATQILWGLVFVAAVLRLVAGASQLALRRSETPSEIGPLPPLPPLPPD